MDRRAFLSTMGVGLLAAPPAVEAQQADNLPRIGVLFIGPRDDRLASYVKAHEEGLRALGWVRNRDIVIEERFSGTMDRMPAAVADLVKLNVKAIVTGPNEFIDVVRRSTRTVPIVMVYPTNPIGRGYVASLARPGGNLTGLSWDASPEIAGKYVELLTELQPRPSRIVGIVDPRVGDQPYRVSAEAAAKRQGMSLQYVEVHVPTEVPRAFGTIVSQRAEAIIVFTGPFLWASRHQIADLARLNGLPTVWIYREGPEAGGLMSYGPDLRESWRRAAFYVDKILKGAKPADLPVEQPTKFELVINLKTAKALGLTIPQSLLLRADQVIE